MSDLKVKQELKITEPDPISAYGISVVDWDNLKNKIRGIKDEHSIFTLIWPVFLGAAISSVIYTITSEFPVLPNGAVSSEEVISWAASIICFAISICCYFYNRTTAQAQKIQASSILEQMEMIEARYKSASAENYMVEESEIIRNVIFDDKFQNFDGWEPYNDGAILLSNDITPLYGDFCLKKDITNDPHGGFKIIGRKIGLGFVFSGWIYRPSSQKGGKGDRIAIEDESFNGYGFAIAHGANYIAIERREFGISSEIGGRVPFNPPNDSWFNFEFHSTPDGKFALHINDIDGNRLSETTAVDSKYTLFDRVVIHGGHPYYVDGLKILTTR